jgi:hypothetical protein
MNVSVRLCVCKSVFRNNKKRRFLTKELKVGHPHEVICPLPIPSKYLFLCVRRKFEFNKKISRKLLIVSVYYQPNLCITPAERGLEELFLKQWEKVPLANMQ